MKFMDKDIIVDITIPSYNLKGNILSVIESTVRKKYENKAFEFGIIQKIIKVKKILKEQITNIDANLYLVIEMNVSIYVPHVYDIIEMKVKKILSYGIYLELPFIKCLISLENDTTKNTPLEMDQVIKVKLSDIRFDTNSFHCIGKLL